MPDAVHELSRSQSKPVRGQAGAVRPDWVSKTLAGFLLGLWLALAVSAGLTVWLADLSISERGQLAMWSVPPVWLCVWSSVYFFASGRRAWCWLGGACLLLSALVWGAQWLTQGA